jgi:hypothetical protein
MAVHHKRVAWPVGMSLDTGWLNESGVAAAAARAVKAVKTSRFADPGAVVKKVCEVTGARRSELLQAISGPRANPPRRFAVHALRKWSALTHAQIGAALSMSTNQVANVLRRFDESSEPMKRWTNRLDAELCDK